MDEVSADELRRALESLHSCRVTFVQSVPVREIFRGKVAWDGLVGIFDIDGHPNAKRAYAWSLPIKGSDERRIEAVLQLGTIIAPIDAVRAAIIAEHRRKRASPAATNL